MLGAEGYPIALVEMKTYSQDADRFFKGDEQEKLKEFLAVNPEMGEVIPGTGGVRALAWPLGCSYAAPEAQIVYYFRDLNMPLYLLALQLKGDEFEFDEEFRDQVSRLVEELVKEHAKNWALVLASRGIGPQ